MKKILSLCFGVVATSVGLNAQYPQYAGGAGVPAVYTNLETIQVGGDVAVIGFPSSQAIDLIVLDALVGGTQLTISHYQEGNGGVALSQKQGGHRPLVYTSPAADLPRGTVIRIDVQCSISLPGASGYSSVDAGSASPLKTTGPGGINVSADWDDWTTYVGANGDGTEGTLVVSRNEGVLAVVLDYVALDPAGLVLAQGANSASGGFNDVTGGIQLPQTDLGTGIYYNFFGNLNSSYGLGWPGFLQARRLLSNWTAGTSTVEWETSIATLSLTCPASEALYSAGASAYSDDVLSQLLADGSVGEFELDETFPFTASSVDINKPFTIGPSAVVSVPNGASKRISAASVSNQGQVSFNAGPTPGLFGELELTGSVNQVLSGFDDLGVLTVNKSGGNATLSSALGNGRIRVQPGGRIDNIGTSFLTIESGDSLVLSSDEAGTAAIVTNNGSIQGKLTIERFIQPDPQQYSWTQIGNVVPGATPLDIRQDIPGCGPLYRYNPATRSYSAIPNDEVLKSPWLPDTDPNYGFEGYFLEVPATATGHTISVSTPSDFLLPADAQVQIPLSPDGAGWNLLVNPFAAPISVSTLFTDNEFLAGIAIYSGANREYQFVSPSTQTNFPLIDVGQGFWVRRQGVDDVVLPNSQFLIVNPAAKTTTPAPFVRSVASGFDGVVGLNVFESADPEMDATTYVSFYNDAVPAYDKHDFQHLGSWDASRFEIWTTSPVFDVDESVRFKEQSVGDLAHTASIPVVIESKLGGDVVFKLENEPNNPEFACVRLFDSETDTYYQLSFEDEVVLELEPNTVYDNRFMLDFSTTPSIQWTSGYCNQGAVVLDNSLSEEPISITFLDASTGEVVASAGNSDELVTLGGGSYQVEVIMDNGCTGLTSFEISDVCMGEMNDNGLRDVQDLMGILSLIGTSDSSYQEIDSKGADCDCDGVMTNMDILSFLSAFGVSCN